MRPVDVGLVIPLYQAPPNGAMPGWKDVHAAAVLAEEVGFDRVWIPDELLWDVPSWGGSHGWWECVAMTGALAAATSRIEIGTWVLSALHRNPALTAKVVATLDEISGGRFVLGLGSGHAGAQGKAFGYPLDFVVGRYEEALQIIVPMLRQGRADYAGRFHRAEAVQLPPGPRPGAVPIMLGGHRPRTIDLAVRHADIWSAHATDSSLPVAFVDTIDLVDRTCEEQGRDPASLGRSIGVIVDFLGDGSGAETFDLGVALAGEPGQIADAVRGLAAVGATSVEFMPFPASLAAVERAGEVLALLDS